MNNILLIDDDIEFANSFKEDAALKSIVVLHKKSFVGLKEMLPKLQYKIAAVILDIRCLIKDDQEKEEASFIPVALKYLDMNAPGFPRFLLTGDDVEFDKFKGLYTEEKVFLKTPQNIQELFQELTYCINNCEAICIKRENAPIFKILEDKKMNATTEQLLINILKKGLKEIQFIEFKGILADIRSFQESIYKSINARNKPVVPDKMFRPNGMLKFNLLMEHLNGYPNNTGKATTIIYQNNTISQFANSLYWSCGEYVHEDPNRSYFISHYSIKSLVYNLMELIIWSSQY